jgi:iron complex transport system ATP-binding protein
MSGTPAKPEILEASGLAIGYRHAGRKPMVLASGLNLILKKGQVTGLLGPNGSGKSTLLRTLSGLQPVIEGTIQVLGNPVISRNVKQTARILSIVLTERIEVRNLSVFEMVGMGRYPHNNWMGRISKADRAIIDQALDQVHLSGYSSQLVDELSDGEQQRVLIARALAQDTPLIILDEPTAHLDLPNRISTMHLLKSLAGETGKSILFSSHDLDLAIMVTDILWLLKKGGELLTGHPDSLMQAHAFEQVFSADQDLTAKEVLANYFLNLRNRNSR